MATHLFTLVLGSDTQCTDDVAERVFLDVGDDTVFGMCNAAAYIDFEREADSFREAVLSAIAAVERIGLRVEHVEPGDYVSRAEIARRIDKTREYVCQLARGETGHRNFPPPACRVSERSPCWRWSDVASWLVREGMLGAEEADRASFVALINACLEWRRFGQTADDIRRALLPGGEQALATPMLQGSPIPLMTRGERSYSEWPRLTDVVAASSETSAEYELKPWFDRATSSAAKAKL